RRGGGVGGGLPRAATGLLASCGEVRPKGGEGVDHPVRLAALGTSPRSGEELWETVFFELRPDSSPVVGRSARRAGRGSTVPSASLRSAPPRAAGRSCGRRSSSSSDRTPPHLWGGPPEGRGGGRPSPPPRCARHPPAQRRGLHPDRRPRRSTAR